MLEITNEDISRIETKFKLTFDDESKLFIKCLETIDIQACPGAGKTTSLVAKLDILSEQMPFDDNSGVLVLTHTNVAVDEIKSKLGVNANKVLGYPNHVGTFQAFINKYMAIPMYINYLGYRPERIDSHIFNKRLLLKLNKYALGYFIPKISKDNKYPNIEKFLGSLEVEDTKVVLRLSGGKAKTIVNKGKPSYDRIKRALEDGIVEEVVSEGYLTYDHCYDLAHEYLEKYPQVAKVFQNRFKFVFIDEVQDTNDKQFSIIDKLFKDSDVILQRIGDNNQAIFNFLGNKEVGWDVKENNIEISDTKRLSKKIADVATKVALECKPLSGNECININPTVIVFDDDNIEKVIPRFVDLLIQYNLDKEDSPVFKAIGGVAKQSDKGHTLWDYFLEGKKDIIGLDEGNLIDKIEAHDIQGITLNEYRNIVLDIIKIYLKDNKVENEDKYFTKGAILKHLRENHPKKYEKFKLLLLKIVSKWSENKFQIVHLERILEVLLKTFDESLDKDVLKDIVAKYAVNFEKVSESSVHRYNEEGRNFDVGISTIHKVKGETHTATLVLETFKDGYDLFQLLDLLKGNKKAGLEAKKKLIYVAMSRATHFLCLAIHKKHIHRNKNKEVTDKDIASLKDNGFDVVLL